MIDVTIPATDLIPQTAPPPPLSPWPPLVINAAITGMLPRRERVPSVPVTAEQIVEDAIACADAGAAIVHLHARDEAQDPDWRRSAYEAFIPAIRRERPELVICVTTSGRTFGLIEQRADVLELDGAAKPDMASLTLSSLNFRTGPSINAPDTIDALAARMLERGIAAELEIFDLGMAAVAHDLLRRDLLRRPLYANLLLGNPSTAPATAGALAALVAALPSGTVWAAAGLGAYQLPINAIATFMGGHVRTGLEDNPFMDWGRREPATNAGLVRRIADLARQGGRRLATAGEVRAALGLGPSAVEPA